MTDTKWRSPTGASIANHETDHIPDGGRMVSKTMNDLKTVRDALSELLDYEHPNFEQHEQALATLDLMIETPAPTEIDLEGG